MSLKPMRNWTREDFVAAHVEADKAVREANTIHIDKASCQFVETTDLAASLSKSFGELAARDRHPAGKGIPERLTHEDIDAHTNPGLTASVRLHDSSVRAALVVNDAGDLFVGVKALDGLNEEVSSNLAQLIIHLSAVTRLACDLQVSAPRRAGSLPVSLHDDRDRGLDQDRRRTTDADQFAPAGQDGLLKSSESVSISFQGLAGVNDGPSGNRPIAHNSSPSVDGAGAHSVGEADVAGDGSTVPATEVTDPQISARYDRPLNQIAINVEGEDDVYLPRDGAFSFMDEIKDALEVQAKLGGAA